ncbi:hypothetical protein SBI67_08085 [Mycolicibacterium sp. 120266]|uniref:hypothetical protein n=1 Tax=Mycolicibacterium sp. 120266 TaxID=3090601 RepID=UPI00299D80DE|nr:hypothetical protein [Mycolicibacterium sp. 120266]MDX1872075.1 hypothetical protein [Mycolicibacterium sp. 120266]
MGIIGTDIERMSSVRFGLARLRSSIFTGARMNAFSARLFTVTSTPNTPVSMEIKAVF